MNTIHLLAIVLACGSFAVNGEEAKLNTKIVGGTIVVDRSKFAYQASLRYNGEHFCGGVIYDEKHVLTAAHCIKDVPKISKLTVVADGLYLSSSSNKIKVSTVKMHKEYNSASHSNDIAVIKLDESLSLNKNTAKIDLWNTTEPNSGTMCVVSGWGSTRFPNGQLSNVLQSAEVNYVANATCAMLFQSDWRPGMLCAGNRGKDSCTGDSGGPLVCENKLVGLVSWGVGCANPVYPGVYTDIKYYEEWIKDNSGSNVPTFTVATLLLTLYAIFTK